MWAPSGAQSTEVQYGQYTGLGTQEAFTLFEGNADITIHGAVNTDGYVEQQLATKSGYRVERVVGSQFIRCVPYFDVASAAQARSVLVKIGFIVLPTDETGALLEIPQLFDSKENERRWLWRREWVLYNTHSAVQSSTVASQTTVTSDATIGGYQADLPAGNYQYSGSDCNHRVDFKPRVTVGFEQRFVRIMQAQALTGYAGGIPGNARFILQGVSALRMFITKGRQVASRR